MKLPIKAGECLKSALVGNLRNSVIRVLQEATGVIDPQVVQEDGDVSTADALEEAAERRGRHRSSATDLMQRDRFAEVSVQEGIRSSQSRFRIMIQAREVPRSGQKPGSAASQGTQDG